MAVSRRKTRKMHRRRGAAAVLAMMFLVIFSSLAAAMAIVSQGNLSTADSHLKINRSLATAETGMHFVIHRLSQIAQSVTTRDGAITGTNAGTLWTQVRSDLVTSFAADLQYQNASEAIAVDGDGTLHLPAIPVGPGAPSFSATFEQHPLVGEDYGSTYYARPPYSDMTPAVSTANPLDNTWVRITVIAHDGPEHSRVYRSIAMDFKMDKKIRYALLSRSRVMIGRNVLIDGPVGSRFMEVNLANGHPVQMESDFRGLHPDLDSDLDLLLGSLVGDPDNHDTDGDNRIHVGNSTELGSIDPTVYDVNSDGYIDGFDMFMKQFGSYDSFEQLTRVSVTDLESGGVSSVEAAQLLKLIDTFGDPSRPGYKDGFIDDNDRYAKIRGQVYISADQTDWNNGAANPNGDNSTAYQDFLQGPIHPDYQEAPLTFNASENDSYQFEPSDFDVSSYRDLADGDLAAQAASQIAANPDGDDPEGPQPLSQVTESVPFGAAHPYDYYDRPVYENMVFDNIRIPKGTNALFRNCTFRGVTFIDSEVNNTDSNYNYAGMQENSGDWKHPDRTVTIEGSEETGELGSKLHSNNLRFHNCTFEGGIVTDAPQQFTHTRNKLAFTGKTDFDLDNLSESEKTFFKRSTILAPHYSVEMGTFIDPTDAGETVELSGTIVAGVLDMRGQVQVNGTILTTFEPKSNEGPVLGETSPQFNTTLGYFSSSAGDLEAELPSGGWGVIQVSYDPTLPLPDGILGPIELTPVMATYFEGGKH